MNPKLFILAGEKSGDLIGSRLVKALKSRFQNPVFQGVGGSEMREEGFDCLLKAEEFEVHGFSEILFSLPKLKRQFQLIQRHILQTKPHAVILIDYPGFNLRLATALRKHNFSGKIIQYVSPTVWAWGKGRIKQMAESLDLLMTIYPFEKEYYQGSSLNVRYVGNPVLEHIADYHYDDNWARLFGIKEPETIVALFPGSRKKEIQLNLPLQLQAAEILKKKNPRQSFAISCAHEKIMPVMRDLLHGNTLKLNRDIFLVPKGYSYELMKDCRTAIATSGTVTLELALHGKPTVVTYQLGLLNQWIAKYLLRLRLPHYCIVNILKNKTVFPELIASGLSSENISSYADKLQKEGAERAACIEECLHLAKLLQDQKPASHSAADCIEEVLR